MARLSSSDPDVMAYRSGGGCVSLFGLPFLAAGLGVMTSFLWATGGEAPPAVVVIPFGGLFAGIGAAFVFGRAGKIIDRRAGTVTTWWGLLVPFKTTVTQLADYERVTLSREVRRSKNSTYTVYPVRLVGAGAGGVKIEEPRNVNAARKTGEEVAKFVGLPLADSSSGALVVREADQLDESLRDQARRTGERADVREPPPDARATHSVAGDSLAFDIPPTGFRLGHYFAMGVGLVFPLIVLLVFFPSVLGSKGPSGSGKWLVAGLLTLFFVILPLVATWGAALSSARATTRVEVSPALLRVSTTGLFRTKTTVIPTDQLEELQLIRTSSQETRNVQAAFLGGAEIILARSDDASATFGAGLSRRELEWIKAVIENVVTA